MTTPMLEFGTAWSAALRRVPEADLAAWLSLAIEMCEETDRLAMRSYRQRVPATRKPDRTFVTEADQAIERLIRERIRAVHPDHGLVGEEYGEEAGSAAVRWYIDPIDGTHNFIRGVPLFATLLAVEVEGEMQLGVMSAPALGERWYAARGHGAWVVAHDGLRRRLRVSEVDALGDAQLVYGSRREDVASGLMPGFDAVIDACWRERGFGDFWGYALVGGGRRGGDVRDRDALLGHRRPDDHHRRGRRSGQRRDRGPRRSCPELRCLERAPPRGAPAGSRRARLTRHDEGATPARGRGRSPAGRRQTSMEDRPA